MITLNERTFVSLSIGMLATMLSLVFAAGMDWNRFGGLEEKVDSLAADFKHYVVEPRMTQQASTDGYTTRQP